MANSPVSKSYFNKPDYKNEIKEIHTHDKLMNTAYKFATLKTHKIDFTYIICILKLNCLL